MVLYDLERTGDGVFGCGLPLRLGWLDGVRMRLSSRIVPLGVASLILVLLSFELSGIDRPRQKFLLRTKSGSMDPHDIVLLLGSIYLMTTLVVLINTGLRPSSHNKYLRVFRSLNSSLVLYHVVRANS